MELLLNLAWLLVAGTMVCLWLRGEGRNNSDRRRQLIAIAVLIAILFPVISVSDDLLAMQNASEGDNYLRRDHLVPSNTHPVPAASLIMASVILSGVGFGFLRLVAPSILPSSLQELPALACIDNRPPPGF